MVPMFFNVEVSYSLIPMIYQQSKLGIQYIGDDYNKDATAK